MTNLNKIYNSSEIVRYYSLNRNKWKHLYKSERKIISKLNLNKSSRVLDIGSACGGLGEVLSQKYNIKSYDGIEINKKAYLYSKLKNPKFNFCNSDLLNYQKRKKKISRFEFVFSLGCVDWNLEFDKMLKKAWKHVEKKGFLIITLRLTDISKFKKSYQYINFYKRKRGEKANYQVLFFKNLSKKLSKFNMSKILSYGYWGKPNPTVVTTHKRIFFIALAIQKNNTKKNLISLDKLDHLIK